MRASPSVFDIEFMTDADAKYFMVLARISHEESRYRDYSFNELYVMGLFREAIENTAFGCKLVCGGEMVGFFMGHISTLGFCDKMIGMDDGFYILPAFRRGHAARMMLDLFYAWCDANNAHPMALIHFAEDNEKTYNFLMKSGMVERGRLFGKG